MLKLFITPTAVIFEDLTEDLFQELTDKHNLDFTIEEGEYKIEDEPQYLYKLILKLSYDYDIEIN